MTTKICEYCKEEIKDWALICIYCWEDPDWISNFKITENFLKEKEIEKKKKKRNRNIINLCIFILIFLYIIIEKYNF